ncbi:MAG: family NAD(P)-dependent oxidoreductase [Actinomycetia bacterium]|nr:family NAD(P)-dependent oxidoreductase [Actinomycetes bacterium]
MVVTGASAGVGRATATAFGRAGWSVGLLARGGAGLAAAADDVGGRSLVVPTDVVDAEAVEAAAQRVEDELGPIDAWVNVAMTTVFAWSWDVSADELRRATEVTYLGQVHGTMAALRRMRPRDRGVICNVGSALAHRAIPLQSAYCGAKFAVRGFTEAVRCELLAEGSAVRLTEVHLPAVNTPQFTWCLNRLPMRPQPVPPVYAPEVAADRIVLAVTSPRRHRVLGGFNRALITANKVAPGVVDRYVARTAVASQQTDEPAVDGRADLWAPVDDAGDHGPRGPFAELEGGMRNRRWLAGLPRLAVDLAAAVVGRV